MILFALHLPLTCAVSEASDTAGAMRASDASIQSWAERASDVWCLKGALYASYSVGARSACTASKSTDNSSSAGASFTS